MSGEKALTDQIYIQEVIKNRLKSGCRSFSLPVLLSKNLKIKPYGTTIMPFLYGCETWSLTLREVRGLSVLENWVLRRTFGPKGDVVTGEWRKL